MIEQPLLESVTEPVEWITDPARFAEISGEWDRIADRQRLPFLLSPWIDTWFECFAPGRKRLTCALWRDGALVAGAPLLGGRGKWELPANDHWWGSAVLAADDAARRELTRALVSASDATVAPGLAEGEDSLDAVVEAASAAHRWTLVEPMHTSLVVETSGALEDYRASLSPKFRSELGRLQRKAAREHDLSIDALSLPDDLDRQLSRAFAIESSGWKGRAGTAITSLPETERFYRQLAHRLHDSGKFRISELRLDGEVAAIALSILHCRRVYTLKFAYDESHRSVGPGFLLLLAMIERCFEWDVEAYEFSGPDHEYERRFATGGRMHWRARVYRPTIANAGRYGYHRQIRPRLKSAYLRIGIVDRRAVAARYRAWRAAAS